ncbi:MAG: PEP-CTERM sorting domain-containing protein [Pseudomonadota bacterium]|nr:PEP-CTERM sorting domain-containing protein [Pseudomonadota bacterium]
MNKTFRATAVAAACFAGISSAQAITFNTFVTAPSIAAAVGGNSTIGFAYAGNKFVGSVYYNTQLYSTNLTGGGVTAFGAPVAAFAGGETYVSSSLGIGGFGPRDVYAGNQTLGSVYRFANNGSSQSLFASGLVGGVRSIAFDPYGAYGNNMIVATSAGNIYQINSAGVASLLASVGADTEGLSFAPQAFGPYAAGTLFVASEGLASLLAITPAGVQTVVASGLHVPEMVSFVPLNLGSSGNPVEGFYAASYATDIQKAAASDFVPYIGDAIVTGEGGHEVYDIHWNGSTFTSLSVASFPGQAEDGIFVTADIIATNPVPEPETYALLASGLAMLGWVARRRKAGRSPG